LQTVDIIVLVVLVLPALVGVLYGFLNILFSIIAWVFALGISIKFGNFLSPVFSSFIDTAVVRDVLAFISLFIVSLMIFTALGYFIVKLLGRSGLTAADRLLGFFFGAGLGGAIVAVAVFLAGFTSVTEEPWWQNSRLLEPFERIAVWSHRFLPDNVVEYHRYGASPVNSEAK
jgi:membrane protein required for colicin V production